MPGLSLKNINKTYHNGQKAIKDFNLEIQDGDFLILSGPESSGKTTLLRMLAGLEEITSGMLLINGKDMTVSETKDRNLAMLFENSVLYPGMDVRGNLEFALRIQKLPQSEIEHRTVETAELLGLQKLLEKMPEELSKEETCCALLGRALIRKPEMLLLERILAGAEEKVQKNMRQKLCEIHKKTGITIIYATDNQETASAVGTRMVVVNDGILCQDGTPKELYDNPCSVFVAEFVGRPPMNMTFASVKEEEGALYFSFQGGSIPVPEDRAALLKRGSYVGKELILGIRPENIHLSEKKDEAGYLSGEVLGTETWDGCSYLKFCMGENEFLARVEQTPKKEELFFSVDADKLHLFDKDSEKAIIS